jgi:hypothetical protein
MEGGRVAMMSPSVATISHSSIAARLPSAGNDAGNLRLESMLERHSSERAAPVLSNRVLRRPMLPQGIQV